jgi:hypothetical protein
MTNISVNQVNIPDLNIDFVRSLPKVEYRYRGDLPTKRGVYFVCSNHPHFQVLYVGQTYSFKSRFSWKHSRDVEFDAIQLTQPIQIYYLSLDWIQDDIEILEYVCIRKLKPSLNVIGAIDGAIIIPDLPFKEQQAIAEDIDRSLDSYSMEELSAFLVRIGINLGTTRKTKAWMIKTIKDSLSDGGRNIRSYEKRESLECPVILVKKIKRHLSESPNLDIEEIKRIDCNEPSTYENIGIREMKKIASALQVCGYSVMTKDELATRITAISQQVFSE